MRRRTVDGPEPWQRFGRWSSKAEYDAYRARCVARRARLLAGIEAERRSDTDDADGV